MASGSCSARRTVGSRVRLAELDVVRRRPARAFEVLFGLALVVEVLTDVTAGGWAVHTGALYPWRWIRLVPLYPTWLVAVLWAATAASGLAIALGRVPALARRLAAAATFLTVVERYSNHGVLLFLVALFLSLGDDDPRAPAFDDEPHPTLGLVRAQLLLVYVTSALNKLAHGFASGHSLANLLGWDLSVARPLSLAVIAAELLLPVLLVLRPKAGMAGVVLLHLGFALVMPGLWSFGLAMTAAAVLFTR